MTAEKPRAVGHLGLLIGEKSACQIHTLELSG